jgi:hypothetical protein
MVICRANSGQTKTDHFKFTGELLRALLIEHGIFKAIIPQTKMCRDLLKDIFLKEYHRKKRRPGHQGGV